jgi:tRNA modification GTPase
MVVLEAGQAHAPLQELPPGIARLEVYNKLDLAPGFVAPAGAVAASAKTGVGIEALRAALLKAAGWSAAGESVFLARERHLRALHAAASCLEAAAGEDGRWEIFAEELRRAQEALARITGEVTADDLLGEIFSRFCIGK